MASLVPGWEAASSSVSSAEEKVTRKVGNTSLRHLGSLQSTVAGSEDLGASKEPVEGLSPKSLCGSVDSQEHFADFDQTVLLFDWDDTLFPTTELFDRWGLPQFAPDDNSPEVLSASRQTELLRWQEELYKYISAACSLSAHCVIVTNARRPWVHSCTARFAPALLDFLDRPNGVKVVYAMETLASAVASRRIRSRGSPNLRPVRYPDLPEGSSLEGQDIELLTAKTLAIEKELKRFYSRYPGQTWKNIISLGDMRYEHDAVQEVAFRHSHLQQERMRVKSLILPGAASLSQLRWRMGFSRVMLPIYVRYDGDFDVNLRDTDAPLDILSSALAIPELKAVKFPLHAWGLADLSLSEEEALPAALDELHEVLESVRG